MRPFFKIVVPLLIFVLAAVGVAAYLQYYHLFFARTITGEVLTVYRVEPPTASDSATEISPKGSFAVAVEDANTKEIMVASTDDQGWATVSKGNCVTARFFPYPPWRLDKAGAYFGAQVITFLKTCQRSSDELNTEGEKTLPPSEAPSENPPEQTPVNENPDGEVTD